MDYTDQLLINRRLGVSLAHAVGKAAALVDSALTDHLDDLKTIFLRDKTLAVSLGLTIAMDQSGRIAVDLATGYVKERVKDKTSASVTPGQETLPGMGGGSFDPVPPVQPVQPEDHEAGEDVGRRDPCNVGSVQHSDSPFYCGDGMEYCDVENRLMRVKEMDAEQLRQVIELPGCQKQVVQAAKSRLKKLENTDFDLSREASTKKQLATVAGMRTEQLVRMLEMAVDAEQENRRLWPVEVVEAARKRLSVLRGEVMTCGNCGSREGDMGCGLDAGENDEPCNSWSLKAAVA